MTRYLVHLQHAVSTAREVEADDIVSAIDAAESADDLPTPGSKVGEEYDAAGEWEAIAVEHATCGEQVWSNHADEREAALEQQLAALTGEVEQLRKVAAAAGELDRVLDIEMLIGSRHRAAVALRRALGREATS